MEHGPPNDIRRRTAAKILAGTRDGIAAARRVHPAGRCGGLDVLLAAAPPAPPPAAQPHPSWVAAALQSLPLPVARLHLDRLDPAAARGVVAILDPDRTRNLAALPPATPSDPVEGLLGRAAIPRFPASPSWAEPPGTPQDVARRVAADPDWPATTVPGEVAAAAAAWNAWSREGGPRDAPSSNDATEATATTIAVGLARLALALLRHPDEAWGLAGRWPRRGGAALLAAWNAWPDLGGLEPSAREALAAAHARTREKWLSWAG